MLIQNVTIQGVTRLTNSANGNPRFRLTLSDGHTYDTQADASCNYEVTNYANSHKPFDCATTRRNLIYLIGKPGSLV